MKRKGQAAMEYLMTYGWALLVIIIVIAILLVILGRMLKGTPDCTFEEAGFTCNQPRAPEIRLTGPLGGGIIYGVFQHTLNEPINITRIGFVEGSPSIEKISTASFCTLSVGTFGEIKLSPREQITFGDLVPIPFFAGGIPVRKYNPAEERCEDERDLQVGSQVRGVLCIFFTRPSTEALGMTGVEESQCATVIADVQ